ncbi:ATP synthase [Parvimonas sp. KA00067]|nr:ATP synthase [Parvimonas sp. KA00067]
MRIMQRQYLKLEKIDGPLIVLKGVDNVSYDEMMEIVIDGKEKRRAKVVRIQGDKVIAQVFEGTTGISTQNSAVTFTGTPLEISLSKEILGRTFNGVGEPIDNGDAIISDKKYNVNGRPMNPVAREYPRDYLETGISAIDSLTTLIRGQKLPIFSSNGLTHNELAAQIVRQAKLKNSDEKFAIVFAGMGIKHDDYDFFRTAFEESGASSRVVSYINLADAPIVERISTPRTALTAAEYLAFEEGMHILVVMTDITSYAEALREISSAREEVPSRKGYPGYLYSDLSTLYERAGMVKGKKGSITLIPILTMPNDDITHPIPDLTGFITEGQIVLSRDLFQKNIYPPINILPSLSRLMKDGIGAGFTREDHDQVQSQLFALYSRVIEVRSLSQIIGEDDLTQIDKIYMEFGRQFEQRFLSQDFDESRTIEESLDIAWDLFKLFPKIELDRLESKYMEKYGRW